MQCLETFSSGKDEEFVNWAVALTLCPMLWEAQLKHDGCNDRIVCDSPACFSRHSVLCYQILKKCEVL